MNIAVVVAGGLVETLQAAPLVATLGSAGNGSILLAAPTQAQAVSATMTGVDEFVFLRTLGGGDSWLSGALALRRRRLDAVVLCSSRSRDRLLAYSVGAARRLGPGGGALATLLTTVVPDDRVANRTDVWTRLGASLGAPAAADGHAIDPGEVARRRAETLLLGGGFEDGRPLVGLVPGLTAAVPGLDPERLRWNVERLAHLANQLVERYGAGVVLLAEADERPLVDALLLDVTAPPLILCGDLTLVEMTAVAERCDLLIAADSPLLHLAAAVGTPTVGLFGPTEGRRRGPLGSDHRIVQALAGPGTPATIQRVRVDDVLAAIEATLGDD